MADKEVKPSTEGAGMKGKGKGGVNRSGLGGLRSSKQGTKVVTGGARTVRAGKDARARVRNGNNR